MFTPEAHPCHLRQASSNCPRSGISAALRPPPLWEATTSQIEIAPNFAQRVSDTAARPPPTTHAARHIPETATRPGVCSERCPARPTPRCAVSGSRPSAAPRAPFAQQPWTRPRGPRALPPCTTCRTGSSSARSPCFAISSGMRPTRSSRLRVRTALAEQADSSSYNTALPTHLISQDSVLLAGVQP